MAYTLLERKPNQRLGQAAFEDKKVVFANSQFALTADVARLAEWTPARLEQRQRELARIATAIWRIDFP